MPKDEPSTAEELMAAIDRAEALVNFRPVKNSHPVAVKTYLGVFETGGRPKFRCSSAPNGVCMVNAICVSWGESLSFGKLPILS
jgi:hypothetical protein